MIKSNSIDIVASNKFTQLVAGAISKAPSRKEQIDIFEYSHRSRYVDNTLLQNESMQMQAQHKMPLLPEKLLLQLQGKYSIFPKRFSKLVQESPNLNIRNANVYTEATCFHYLSKKTSPGVQWEFAVKSKLINSSLRVAARQDNPDALVTIRCPKSRFLMDTKFSGITNFKSGIWMIPNNQDTIDFFLKDIFYRKYFLRKSMRSPGQEAISSELYTEILDIEKNLRSGFGKTQYINHMLNHFITYKELGLIRLVLPWDEIIQNSPRTLSDDVFEKGEALHTKFMYLYEKGCFDSFDVIPSYRISSDMASIGEAMYEILRKG